MKKVIASKVGSGLSRLVDETLKSKEPIRITGDNSNAILISEKEWNSIRETLYLMSIPGMRDSIKEGLDTPVKDCKEEPGW